MTKKRVRGTTTSAEFKALSVTRKNFSPDHDFDYGVLQGATKWVASNAVTHGPNIPGWKDRIKRRISATTTLDGTRYSANVGPDGGCVLTFNRTSGLVFQPVKYVVTWKGNTEAVSSETFPSTPSSVLYDDAYNAAAERFNAKALEAQRAIQSLVSAGEFGETLRMIRHPFQSLFEGCFDYLSDVKKRTRRARKKRDKKGIISDTWLEHSFGWSPLVNDIRSAADAVARLNTFSPPNKVISSYETKDKHRVVEQSFSGNSTVIKRKCVVTESVSVRMRGCVAVASSDNFPTDVLGLSLRDLVPTIWELIPYSFLVDYFTNVGSLIDYYSLRQQDLRWAWLGHRLSYEAVHQKPDIIGVPDGGFAVSSIENNCGSSTVSCQKVHREAMGGFPIPSFRFKIPGLSTKWLNIGALLAASDRTSRIVNGY